MGTGLIVVGAGGFGREVAWLASEAAAPWRILGFLDDRTGIPESELGGHPLLGTIEEWPCFSSASFVLAIGDPRTRAGVADRMLSGGSPTFATLLHRDLHIGPACRFAPGSIVCAGCVLTTNISVGSHSIINIGTTIGHDVSIGAFVTLAPQVAVSGCVTVGDGVEVGTAAAIRQNLTLGEGAMLGMGSVLTKSMPRNTFFFGVPAKPMKTLAQFGRVSVNTAEGEGMVP
jgi:sugar O-acyltransferase (sialic acid O-acetyltransferase NeuD family)